MKLTLAWEEEGGGQKYLITLKKFFLDYAIASYLG